MTPPAAASLPHLLAELEAQLEADPSLFDSSNLRRRLDLIDRIDALPNSGPHEAAFHQRADSLRSRLEAANAELYRSLRAEIQTGAPPAGLLSLLPPASNNPAPGLSYDHLDELISGILAFEEPPREPAPLQPEMVFYQPTPVRHILRFLNRSALSASDVLIDLGSGLGHVPILASVLSGARSVGIEIEPAYVAVARRCAESLGLTRVSFVQEDARGADLSSGSVFFLYTPFTGSILAAVLEKLRRESTVRPIRIASFGPCILDLAGQPWLEPASPPNADQMVLFHPRV